MNYFFLMLIYVKFAIRLRIGNYYWKANLICSKLDNHITSIGVQFLIEIKISTQIASEA